MKKRVSFKTVLSGSLWLWYDHMGSMALVNMLWFLFCIPIVTMPAVTAGVFAYVHSLLAGRDEGIGAFFLGIRDLGARATLICACLVFLGFVCGANVAFYLFIVSDKSPVIGMVGAGIFFWVGLILSSLCLYLFPVLCHFKRGWKRIVKVSFLLAVAHPFLLIWLFFTFLCLIIVGIVSGIGLLLFSVSLACTCPTVAVVAGLILYQGTEETDLITVRFQSMEEDWKRRGIAYIVKPWG